MPQPLKTKPRYAPELPVEDAFDDDPVVTAMPKRHESMYAHNAKLKDESERLLIAIDDIFVRAVRVGWTCDESLKRDIVQAKVSLARLHDQHFSVQRTFSVLEGISHDIKHVLHRLCTCCPASFLHASSACAEFMPVPTVPGIKSNDLNDSALDPPLAFPADSFTGHCEASDSKHLKNLRSRDSGNFASNPMDFSSLCSKVVKSQP